MSDETISGETVVRALENFEAIVEGDQEYSREAYDEAMEKGLNDHQRAVAEKYAGEGRVEVDSQRIPTLADKLAAGAKIPWTFVLDGVEFIVKTSGGMGSSVCDSEWWWREDGYNFKFYKRSEGGSEIAIEEVDRDD